MSLSRLVAVSLVVSAAVAHAQSSPVYINEYCNDPFNGTTGLDTNFDGTFASLAQQSDDEFIEIVNGDPAFVIDISGWTLDDAAVAPRHTFANQTFLPPGGSIVIFGGGDVTAFNSTFHGTGVLASSGALGLNNSGDTMTLNDASGMVVTSYTFAGGGPYDGDGESITRTSDMPGNTFTMHSLLAGSLLHSAGYQVDGITPWLPAIVPPTLTPMYPGNGADIDIDVEVNGSSDNPGDDVHGVTAGDYVALQFDSPLGTITNVPFLSAYTVFFTGSPPIALPLPPDVAGTIWLDPANVVLLFDGITNPGAVFAPALVAGGVTWGGVIPPFLAGAGFSVMLQAIALTPGFSPSGYSASDAHEFVIN